jgi:hypothetical protein
VITEYAPQLTMLIMSLGMAATIALAFGLARLVEWALR